MNLAETYDHIAEDWHQDHLVDDWWVDGTDVFLSHLSLGARVLDVGCGSGVKSRYMQDHGMRVTGIDISTKLLEIARSESPESSFQQLSMTELNTLGDTYDGVFAQASLLHIFKVDAPAVVRAMANRTSTYGFVYLAVKEVREGKPEEAVVKENDYGYEYERFFSYFTMAELESYLAAAGLEVVWSERNPSPSGKTAWLQIIGKNVKIAHTGR